jgi:hypothetical protein
VWSLFARTRPVSLTSQASECLEFIRSKLGTCDKNHSDCQSLHTQDKKPKRLLRINDSGSGSGMNLILIDTIDASYRYVALSHCWGNSTDAASTIPRTTKENLRNHQSCGLSVASLTRTFQHAVDLTRRLGMQYIWIDSLCIVQDDSEDKNLELPRMGSVYGDAYLVIAATLAENGAHGLYHDRLPFHVEFLISENETLKATVFEKSHHDVWKKGEQFWTAPGLPLLGRAWAFQERMLAKRVVHFTPNELVWECQSLIDCECGDLQNPQTSWPQFGLGKNLKTKHAEVARRGSDRDRIIFWHDICAQYSARNITYPSDRLPALSSIARQVDMPGFLGRFLAGIWECTLPEGLLWWSEYTDLHLYPERTVTHRRTRPCHVPSWSWLSVDGRVSTWGRCYVPLVTVEHVHYIPCEKDQYGSCAEGKIQVLGKTVNVEVTSTGHDGGTSGRAVRLPNSKDNFGFLTDTNPFELSDEDLETSSLLALRFAVGGPFLVHAIIMRLVPDSSGRFERLGIAQCPEEWFTRHVPTSIIMV